MESRSHGWRGMYHLKRIFGHGLPVLEFFDYLWFLWTPGSHGFDQSAPFVYNPASPQRTESECASSTILLDSQWGFLCVLLHFSPVVSLGPVASSTNNAFLRLRALRWAKAWIAFLISTWLIANLITYFTEASILLHLSSIVLSLFPENRTSRNVCWQFHQLGLLKAVHAGDSRKKRAILRNHYTYEELTMTRHMPLIDILVCIVQYT
jgi:hypothetical protein